MSDPILPPLEPQYAGETVDAAAPPPAKPTHERPVFTRLLAADERGLPLTFVLGIAIVSGLLIWLQRTLDQGTWNYEFLFRRGFVQWVLLISFAVGAIHLLRRIPEWWREWRALRHLRVFGTAPVGETMVQRRWLKVREIVTTGFHSDSGRLSTKSLAEHDEAELDAAYRLSSDIVQVLPLMGFFGTVFGLSHGLYQSFLAVGGSTSKDFAKAIAIAFDNTLLGLALTIILFIMQSLLRKREDSLLLQLNLFAESWLSDHVRPAVESETGPHPLPQAIQNLERSLEQFHGRLTDNQGLAAESLDRLAANLSVTHDALGRYGQQLTVGLGNIATAVTEEVARRTNEVIEQAAEQARGVCEAAAAESRMILEGFREQTRGAAAAVLDDFKLQLDARTDQMAEGIAAKIETKTGNNAETSAVVVRTEEKVDGIGEFLKRIKEQGELLAGNAERTETGMAAVTAAIGGAQASLSGLGSHLANLDSNLSEMDDRIGQLGQQVSGIPTATGQIVSQSVEARLASLNEEIRRPRKIRIVEASDDQK